MALTTRVHALACACTHAALRPAGVCTHASETDHTHPQTGTRQVLFRVALALLSMHEDRLLTFNNAGEALQQTATSATLKHT
jgi:hypothetical protein